MFFQTNPSFMGLLFLNLRFEAIRTRGQRLGKVQVIRGEIRWYTFHFPDRRRPVLVLTRDEVIDRLNEIIVVPVTRTVRGLRTEVLLTENDGMPTVCAANFDHLALGQRNRFGSLLCNLPEQRWAEARTALLFACGFDLE